MVCCHEHSYRRDSGHGHQERSGLPHTRTCISSVRLEVEEPQLVANVGIVESVVRSRKYLCERGFLEKVDAQDL